LLCIFSRRTAKKATDGAGMRRRVTPFAVRWEKHTTKMGSLPCTVKNARQRALFVVRSLPCAEAQNVRQRGLFAVRQGPKRTAIKGTFAMRPYKRTTKALFLLLVLVTLRCVFQKTHGKVAIAIFFVFHV
jgi:hypothetical protein